MKQYEVLRDSKNDLLKIGEDFYSLSKVTDKVFKIVSKHSDNPAFDMPGWFYSGSPYGKEILELQVKPLEQQPSEFQPEFVPKLGKVWRAREPLWPQIFKCEVKDG